MMADKKKIAQAMASERMRDKARSGQLGAPRANQVAQYKAVGSDATYKWNAGREDMVRESLRQKKSGETNPTASKAPNKYLYQEEVDGNGSVGSNFKSNLGRGMTGSRRMPTGGMTGVSGSQRFRFLSDTETARDKARGTQFKRK